MSRVGRFPLPGPGHCDYARSMSSSHKTSPVHVIGGGLAGSEAAWQIAEAGIARRAARDAARPRHRRRTRRRRSPNWSARTRFAPMMPRPTPSAFCMRRCAGSARSIMASGDAHKVPAGGALAVDREAFADAVTARLGDHPLIEIRREEIAGLPPAEWDNVIVATGPLTSPALAEAIAGLTGETALAFFDAIAPIVHRDSIDMDIAWFQSRYDKAGPGGTGADYINCPMTRDAVRGLRRRADRRRQDRRSRSGRARPISTAACRSRSWPSAAARRCGTAR